jgi:hypothetical protein
VKVGRGAKMAAATAIASAVPAGDWAQATDLSFLSSFCELSSNTLNSGHERAGNPESSD